MPIETARIVYVFGPSGAGKSFSGDYLAVAHGFEHVDGDYPLKHSHLPENYEMSKNIICAFLGGGGFPPEKRALWSPYFEKIANMTIDAAKTHDRVVLSHATYQQGPRDVVVETLLSGGIKREQITTIQLTIDPRVLSAGHYHRQKRQLEQTGTTMEEMYKGKIEFEGELTEEIWVEWCSSMFPDPTLGFVDDPAAKKVDVSSRGVAHLDNMDRAVGLARDGSLSYEEICAKVLPLDAKRDEESMACGGWKVMGEIFEEATPKPQPEAKEEEEGKEEKMKRRRSSLMQATNKLNSLRLSSRNLSSSSGKIEE